MPVTLSISDDGQRALVRLDRPDRLNALDDVMLADLEGAIRRLASSPVPAVVLAGAGDNFCSGADLHWVAAVPPKDALAFSRRFQRVVDALAALPGVTLAAVEGFALGAGLEIALACDLRVAARNARFGVPEVRYGLLPAATGTVRLVDVLGQAWALRLLLTGEPATPGELPRGFAIVVEPGRAVAAAEQWAVRLADKPAYAVAAIKQVVRTSTRESGELAAAVEASAFSALRQEPDVARRLDSFLARHLAPGSPGREASS